MTRAMPLGFVANCRDCGGRIVLVRIVPTVLSPGALRRRIPLDPVFDPDESDVPASHALTAGRSQCRPITVDDPIAPGELPALTHFATCPARRAHSRQSTPVSTRQNGGRP